MIASNVRENDQQIVLARLLVSRLERLSADSYWAHRSSGLRRSLIKMLEHVEATGQIEYGPIEKLEEMEKLKHLMDKGFDVLEKAARELQAYDESHPL